MRKIRTSAVALLAAGALALTATPAVAQSSATSSGSSASAEVGTALDANEYERSIFGSSKDFDNVTPFGQAWYFYTLAATATATAVAGVVYANLENIENAAAAAGIQLQLPR